MLLLLLLIRSMIRQIEIGAPVCNLPYSGNRCQPGGRCMPPQARPFIQASTLDKKHLSCKGFSSDRRSRSRSFKISTGFVNMTGRLYIDS